MLNVELALPMTPHGAFNLLEDADVCWVIVPFNTDEDEIDEIHAFLVGMTQYFNGRCSVASLDMAYPGNQRTFGGVVDDYPMLLVREANRPGFFKKPIEKGHFEAKDPSDWGYKITSEQIETNLRGSLERVVDKVYEPMSQFQKYHVIYQVWHRSDAAAYFHQRVINDLLKENLGEVDERKQTIIISTCSCEFRNSLKLNGSTCLFVTFK